MLTLKLLNYNKLQSGRYNKITIFYQGTMMKPMARFLHSKYGKQMQTVLLNTIIILNNMC